MRKIILAISALTLATPAMAQTSCQTIGAYVYCQGPGGYSSNSQHLGNTTYIHETYGPGAQRSTMCQRLGNYTYCN